jgi:hypothetical protein
VVFWLRLHVQSDVVTLERLFTVTYHEWAVVRALRARGHRLDAAVQSDGITQAWQRLAHEHGVELAVLGSYVDLEQWVVTQQQVLQPDGQHDMERRGPRVC